MTVQVVCSRRYQEAVERVERCDPDAKAFTDKILLIAHHICNARNVGEYVREATLFWEERLEVEKCALPMDDVHFYIRPRGGLFECLAVIGGDAVYLSDLRPMLREVAA